MLKNRVPIMLNLVVGSLMLLGATAVFAQGPPDVQPPPASPPLCAPGAFTDSLDGEKATIDRISVIPQPLPMPALLAIANNFRRIGQDVAELRSFQLVAVIPQPLPHPALELEIVRRAVETVAVIPEPMPRPARELLSKALELLAVIPQPLPRSAQATLSNWLKNVAVIPQPVPEPARKVLELCSQLVAELPIPAPEPVRQQLLAGTEQLIQRNALGRLALLEQEITAVPEAAPLLDIYNSLKQSIEDLLPPPCLPLCDGACCPIE